MEAAEPPAELLFVAQQVQLRATQSATQHVRQRSAVQHESVKLLHHENEE